MRKHLGWYARWIPAASALRRALVGSTTAAEVAALLDAYFLQRRTWEPGMDLGGPTGEKL
jgi:tRNA-dihydrouridine synthase